MGTSTSPIGHITASIAIPLIALLPLAACSESDRGDTGQGALRFQIDTVSGITHIRNQGQPPEWAMEELLTLGADSSEATQAVADEFGFVTGVIGDSAGFIYVADAQAAEIRVFDERGDLVQRIGRRGAGPGEFIALLSIGWLGNRLATLDVGNARLGILSRRGEWIGQRTYRGGDVGRLVTAGDGALYMPNVRLASQGPELSYVRQTESGPSDTLVAPPVAPNAQPRAECTHTRGTITATRQASFSPRQVRVPVPGMLWAEVWTADYRIAFRTPAGDTVRVVERDIPRREVTDSAWQREVAAFDEFLAEHPDATCDRRTLPRPDAMELLRMVFFDSDRRMWVERITERGFVFDVFDSDGRLLVQLPAPDRWERVLPHVLGDRLHLVVTDDLGVHHVKVYRLGAIPIGR